MNSRSAIRKPVLVAIVISNLFFATSTFAADIKGQVLGAGVPITQSTVTLLAASAGPPKQLAQTKTDNDGRFEIHSTGAPDSSLYLVATGGVSAANQGPATNPAIALMAVVGSKPPASVVINEFTTMASVVTHAQFIDDTTIKGSPLQLRIAAGNVPNFVDFETGSWGPTILDALNSAQTPTMANFATLANMLAGCVTRVRSDACSNSSRQHVSERRRSRRIRCLRRKSIASLPLAPAGQNFRRAQRVLSAAQARHARQALAGYAVPAVSHLRAQRLGLSAQVHGRRRQRRRQAHDRQRRQCLGC